MISAFSLTPLHNGEYITFTGTVLDLTSNPALPASVRSAHSVLHALLQRIKAAHVGEDDSPLSGQRRAADADRDRHYASLFQLASVYTQHPDAAKAAAGLRVSDRLANYGSVKDVTAQGFDDESADINSILRDLDAPDMAAAATLIGATDWIAALRHAQQQFEQTSQQRNADRSSRSTRLPDNIETLRKEANKAYRALVEKINAYNLTDEGAAPWPAIIAGFNTLIGETRSRLAARQGRAAAGNAPASA